MAQAKKTSALVYNPNNPGGVGSTIGSILAKATSGGTSGNLTSQGYPSSTSGWANGYGNAYSGSTSGGTSGTSTSGSTTTKKPTSGGSSSGSSASTATPDYSAMIAEAVLAQKQAALNNAINSVDNAYNQKKNLLGRNYNSSVNSLRNQYNNSANELQRDAARSLKEAYVNKMLTQKTLGQQLSAQGFSGGATESTLAGLHNNYGNARNNINTTLNDNLTSLNNTLQTNLASIEQNYNNALADAETARANAIAQLSLDNTNADLSSLLSSGSGFMQQIQNALANQAAYKGVPTEAINDVAYINTEQVNDMGNATQAARIAGLTEQAQEMASKGYAPTAITRLLAQRGAGAQDIQNILNQLS